MSLKQLVKYLSTVAEPEIIIKIIELGQGALAEIAQTDPDPKNRAEALSAFSEIGHRVPDLRMQALEFFIDAFKDKDSDVRSKALDLCYDYMVMDTDLITPHIDIIKQTLVDTDPIVRKSAINLIARLSGEVPEKLGDLIDPMLAILASEGEHWETLQMTAEAASLTGVNFPKKLIGILYHTKKLINDENYLTQMKGQSAMDYIFLNFPDLEKDAERLIDIRDKLVAQVIDPYEVKERWYYTINTQKNPLPVIADEFRKIIEAHGKIVAQIEGLGPDKKYFEECLEKIEQRNNQFRTLFAEVQKAFKSKETEKKSKETEKKSKETEKKSKETEKKYKEIEEKK